MYFVFHYTAVGLIAIGSLSSAAAQIENTSIESCDHEMTDIPAAVPRPVRFRDPSLRMRDASLVDINYATGIARIEFNGLTLERSIRDVFSKHPAEAVFTPDLNYWFTPTRVRLTPLFISVLDEGARVVSDSVEQGEDAVVTIRRVLDFGLTKARYDESAAKVHARSMDEVLETKKAGCLQFSLLAAGILAEGGFNVRLVSESPDKMPGHIWLEVYARDDRGHVTTYVADGAGESVVKTLADVMREAATNSSTLARLYYTSSTRENHGLYQN